MLSFYIYNNYLIHDINHYIIIFFLEFEIIKKTKGSNLFKCDSLFI